MTLKLSAGVYPTVPVQRLVEAARALDGSRCDTLWVGDSHLIWRECWTTITACSAATRSLRFAPCVTNPMSRHPSVTASIVATLQEMSEGRVRLGMGVGDSALRMTTGRVATLAELRSAVEAIRGLLHGGVTHFRGNELQLATSYPGTEIYLSGSGPRTLELAGEIGDGVILVPGIMRQRIAGANAATDRGAEGRSPAAPPLRRLLWVACSIRDRSGDAIDDVRPFVASVLRHPLPFELTPELEDIRARIREQYEFGHHMARDAGHADVVPNHVVKEFALAGTATEVREELDRLRSLPDTRIDEVSLVMMNPDPVAGAQSVRSLFDALP